MPITHIIGKPQVIGLCIEHRCTCGVLLAIDSTSPTAILSFDIEAAFDKHLIGVLETQWVKQFYQEA